MTPTEIRAEIEALKITRVPNDDERAARYFGLAEREARAAGAPVEIAESLSKLKDAARERTKQCD